MVSCPDETIPHDLNSFHSIQFKISRLRHRPANVTTQPPEQPPANSPLHEK